jgi:hypothetical protein
MIWPSPVDQLADAVTPMMVRGVRYPRSRAIASPGREPYPQVTHR